MRNLARKQQEDVPVLETCGEVVAIEEGGFVVATETRSLSARRAASCLLEPVAGDTVLVATTGSGQSYVLAVLERAAGAPWTIAAPGDLDLAAKGTIGVVAREGVQVITGAVRVNAVDGTVSLERLTFLTRFLRAEVGKAKVFGQTLDSVLDRVSQRVKRSLRMVEETDQVRADHLDYTAKTRLALHGQHALITAETLAKIEGDQIHMG
ncbi:hypothetical protein A7982_13715 [Minicystis rosea]|nr:hypothetical protein A7982_13715 [Minicystis rosea]